MQLKIFVANVALWEQNLVQPTDNFNVPQGHGKKALFGIHTVRQIHNKILYKYSRNRVSESKRVPQLS
jgi:uncharacterized membrane protein